MSITDEPLSVNNTYKRHAPQFENIDFLLITLRRCVIRIGQADEG